VSKYFPFVMLRGSVSGIQTHEISPNFHGPFWEYNIFGAKIKPLQLTIVIFPQQFEEFNFYFSKFRY